MSLIYVAITANSPLALSSRHFVSNEIDTLDYIPGSAFRGAIADKLGKEWGYNDTKFRDIFVDGKIKFGNLYLLKEGKGFPIPRSAKTCKYQKGFQPHGVFDFLLPTVRYKQAKEIALDKCPTCQAPLDTFDGFYNIGTGERKKIEPTKRLITRTAIDDRTQTAREGILYSIVTIEEDQEFYGVLDADSDLDSVVIEDKELRYKDTTILKEGEKLWVGLGKTRGLGNIEITGLENVEKMFQHEYVPGNLENRFNDFQRTLSPLNITGFSITLYSDAIIMDKFMRYKSCIDGAYLKEEFNMDNVKCICAFNAVREIPGWNAAWGLPKEKELAIEKGSVFFFKFDAEQENLLETLKQIEMKGIGLRREEGFGRVYICDPFHINNVPENWWKKEVKE
jgi:CRISPR-associated protein Csx10